MKEESAEIFQIMKKLTDIMDKCSSEGTKSMFKSVINDLADLRDILNY